MKKYSNIAVKQELWKLLNGNGPTEVMDAFVQWQRESMEKFKLSNEEKQRVYNSYKIQLDGIIN